MQHALMATSVWAARKVCIEVARHWAGSDQIRQAPSRRQCTGAARCGAAGTWRARGPGACVQPITVTGAAERAILHCTIDKRLSLAQHAGAHATIKARRHVLGGLHDTSSNYRHTTTCRLGIGSLERSPRQQHGGRAAHAEEDVGEQEGALVAGVRAVGDILRHDQQRQPAACSLSRTGPPSR